jgi:hypothetical protein
MARLRICGSITFAMILLGPAPSFAFAGHELFKRQSSCAVAGFSQCSGAPSGFCCAADSKCILLARNTTVLCCPSGGSCQIIGPLTCDITQQNNTKYPMAELKTTNLTGTLTTCGSGCCPFGYSCSGSNFCTMNSNQDSGTPSPTSSSGSSSASAPTSTPLPNNSASTSTPSPTQAACNAFPATAILLGFFPGVVVGVLLAVASFCLYGAYRRRQSRLSGSFGPISASISDPIYNESSAMRADFIRKQGSSPSTPTRQPTIERVRSLFRKSTAASGIDMAEAPRVPVPAIPQPAPRTPRLQREPSGESINIFADPITARSMRPRDSHQTTFTDMMDRADLSGVARGEPFVPRITPPSTAQSSLSRGLSGR